VFFVVFDIGPNWAGDYAILELSVTEVHEHGCGSLVAKLKFHTFTPLPERDRRWRLVADDSCSRRVITVSIESNAGKLPELLEVAPDLQCCDVDWQISHKKVEQTVITPVGVIFLIRISALVVPGLLASAVHTGGEVELNLR
jgi:hypothetical protein